MLAHLKSVPTVTFSHYLSISIITKITTITRLTSFMGSNLTIFTCWSVLMSIDVLVMSISFVSSWLFSHSFHIFGRFSRWCWYPLMLESGKDKLPIEIKLAVLWFDCLLIFAKQIGKILDVKVLLARTPFNKKHAFQISNVADVSKYFWMLNV